MKKPILTCDCKTDLPLIKIANRLTCPVCRIGHVKGYHLVCPGVGGQKCGKEIDLNPHQSGAKYCPGCAKEATKINDTNRNRSLNKSYRTKPVDKSREWWHSRPCSVEGCRGVTKYPDWMFCPKCKQYAAIQIDHGGDCDPVGEHRYR